MAAHVESRRDFDPITRSQIRFSDEALATIRKLMSRYPEGKSKSAMLPVLHVAQAESNGWLSPEVMDYVAELMGLQAIEVYEVASFYSMYNLAPVGKCILDVCRTSSCWTRGAEDIIDYISQKLNIRPGETTADGMFTLKAVECLGSCGTAPMLQVGAEFHENLTEAEVDSLIERLRTENRQFSYTDLEFHNTK